MIVIALIALLILLAAILAGLLAIFWAITRSLDWARQTAYVVIAFSIASSLLLLGMFGSANWWGNYLLTLTPGALGGVALAIAKLSAQAKPYGRYQFPLVALLYGMTVVAVIAAIFASFNRPYGWYRDRIERNFARMEKVTQVEVHGSDHEGSWHLESIRFTLEGRPDTLIVLGYCSAIDNCTIDEPLSALTIRQVGPYQFQGEKYYLADGSFYITQDYLDVGAEGDQRPLLPFALDSIQDVVDHYDDLIELMEQWPREKAPGRIEFEDRFSQRFILDYWVEVEGAAASAPGAGE